MRGTIYYTSVPSSPAELVLLYLARGIASAAKTKHNLRILQRRVNFASIPMESKQEQK